MIIIKSPQEIAIMREGGKILAKILKKVEKEAKPGVTTKELDEYAEKLALKYGSRPSFKGYNNYPSALCVSVNEEVVHGIPSGRKLKEGDIVGLDMGIYYKGLCTDSAVTVGIGKISSKAERLIKVTEQALKYGIDVVKPEAHIGDIGFAIQSYVESQGFSVVRDLVGHGVGKNVHEAPQIPHFGRKGSGLKLKEGMTIAIEPMVNAGKYYVHQAKDGWTFVTSDGSLSAHFEHTMAVTKNGCEILTAL